MAADQTTIHTVLRRYGYAATTLMPAEKGYRNETHPFRLADGQILNLILYKSEPNIAHTIDNANRVSDFLAQRGFPTRRSIDTRVMRLQSGNWQKFAALYTYLPGRTIPWEAYTMAHLKLLGKTMAYMHVALGDFKSASLPDVTDIYSAIFTRMQAYFADPGVRSALVNKLHIAPPRLEPSINVLQVCRQLPDQQALHMDFVRSNILFAAMDAGEIAVTGILDFEKTARGHRVFDIARTLAFLLVDCKYKPADKVRKYFLRSGYQKNGVVDLRTPAIRSVADKVDVLELLLDLFLLYDFYKFLRHNPYEALPQNEHFVRTCDLLLRRDVMWHRDSV